MSTSLKISNLPLGLTAGEDVSAVANSNSDREHMMIVYGGVGVFNTIVACILFVHHLFMLEVEALCSRYLLSCT